MTVVGELEGGDRLEQRRVAEKEVSVVYFDVIENDAKLVE